MQRNVSGLDTVIIVYVSIDIFAKLLIFNYLIILFFYTLFFSFFLLPKNIKRVLFHNTFLGIIGNFFGKIIGINRVRERLNNIELRLKVNFFNL